MQVRNAGEDAEEAEDRTVSASFQRRSSLTTLKNSHDTRTQYQPEDTDQRVAAALRWARPNKKRSVE